MTVEHLIDELRHLQTVQQLAQTYYTNRDIRPLEVRLNLTERCNARCQMCWYWQADPEMLHSQELTGRQIDRLTTQMAAIGCRYLSLSGGEVTLRSDLPEIVSAAAEKGLRVSLTSNGLHLSPAHCATLIRAGLDKITISIHAPVPDIHDAMMGVPRAWQRATQAIRHLREAAQEQDHDLTIVLASVVTSANIESLAGMPALTMQLGADKFEFIYMKHTADSCRQLVVPQEVGNEFMDLDLPGIRQTAQQLGVVFLEHCIAPYQHAFRRQLHYDSLDDEIRSGFYVNNPCYAPWTQILVNPRGDVYPCCFMQQPAYCMGNFLESPLEQIVAGDKFSQFRNGCKPPISHQACYTCTYRLDFNEKVARLIHSAGCAPAPDDRPEAKLPITDLKAQIHPEEFKVAQVSFPYKPVTTTESDETVVELYVTATSRNRFFLYAPLNGYVSLINREAAEAVGAIRVLEKNGNKVDNLDPVVMFVRQHLQERGLLHSRQRVSFYPRIYRHRVDLFLTQDCNLGCVYCFADAGKKMGKMSWKIAKRGIDLAVQGAVHKRKPEFEIVFHGNGEPFTAWSMMRKAVAYAREQADVSGLQASIRCVTNGCLNTRQRQWMIEHLNHVYISIDGLADVQNRQRPFKNGAPSFEQVTATIRAIDQADISFSLRCTVTEKSIHQLDELITWTITHAPRATSLHISPLFPSARSQRSQWRPPSVQAFVSAYLAAWETADKAGLKLVYDGFDPNVFSPYHCDPEGIKLAITPEGYLTLCPEVTSLEDHRADTFIYGEYDEERDIFHFDFSRLQALMRRQLKHIPYCRHCMVRWHCGGECFAKNMLVGDINDPSRNFRCQINRLLFPHQLRAWLQETDKELQV